ncbi:substrate-binding domain-containing protein [Terriglobus sp.]|uniref:substrate-binding domain-containing protein n=1 Tax=Terriglobus sp. TaxID=1889013 RepID=UPI003AFFFA13
MRSKVTMSAAALLLLGTMGCQRHSKSDKYYLIAGNLKVPYWKTATAGFQQAAADYNVTAIVDGPDGEDAGAEEDAFQKAAATKPAGILVSVLDANRMQSAITSAVRSGTPVITIDSDAAQSGRLYFIGTDNYNAGHLGAQRLIQLLHGKGNVVFFTYPAQPNLAERLKGYQDTFNDHAGMKTVDVVNIGGDTSIAFDKVREYVSKTGADKVDAFVSLESVSAKDVADALDRQHVTDRTVIGMDVSPDTVELINKGKVAATIAQKPWTMGYVGLKALAHVHEDDAKDVGSTGAQARFPAFVDTGSALVDKENVGAWQSK